MQNDDIVIFENNEELLQDLKSSLTDAGYKAQQSCCSRCRFGACRA